METLLSILPILVIWAPICEGFTRPISPRDIDEWMWKPAWIPPPHFGEPTQESLNVRLQLPFIEEERDMSPKADLLPFDEALDRMYVTAEGLEEHNELVQEELWKLIEINSENERAGIENGEELEGYSGVGRGNMQKMPAASLFSKREKLFQLLQKLPSHKKRKVRRCNNTKQGSAGQSSDEPCSSKNSKNPSLRREMRRFADLFEFHRQQQKVKPKQPKQRSKRPNSSSSIDGRPRGARKANPGKKSPSVPQKVRRVVGAASETMRAILDLADPLPSERAEQKGQGRVINYYKIFAVTFATIAAVLSI